MGWTCGAYGRGEEVYRVLVGKPEGRRPLGRPRRRCVCDVCVCVCVVFVWCVVCVCVCVWCVVCVVYVCVCLCVSVGLGIQPAMRIHLIAIYGLPRSTIYLHTISQTARFSENKKLLSIKCVF